MPGDGARLGGVARPRPESVSVCANTQEKNQPNKIRDEKDGKERNENEIKLLLVIFCIWSSLNFVKKIC